MLLLLSQQLVSSSCGELNTDHSDCKVELLANDIGKLNRQPEFSEVCFKVALPVNQLINITFKGLLDNCFSRG